MEGRPFALIGVNVGGCSVEQLRNVMTKEQLTWRSFADPGQAGAGAIARQWSLLNTPTLYLIDDQGVIRNKWIAEPGEKAIDAAVEKWVKAAEESARKRPAVQSTPDLTVWPNAVSSANSDRWLIEHHDEIRRLEPRLLVLDFVNDVAVADVRKKVDALIAALAESSRYHGYADPKAPVFLQYRVAKFVDLTDPAPAPKTLDGSSTRYPRVKDWKEGNNFDYAKLHSEEFANCYGYADPKDALRFLTLRELLAAGTIQELWIVARQGDFGGPYECVEQKPVYDDHFARVGAEHRQCGNGGDDGEPWEGRSLRVNYVCYDRGIGCAMEDLGHSFECTAHAGVLPWFTRYFHEFAGFDLDTRFGLPVDSLYAVDAGGKDKASYPDAHTLVVHHAGKELRVENYVASGGNVHFPPNARHDYDLDDPAPVLSTIEHWRCFDGPDGKDLTIEFTPDRFAKYADLAPDCMGSWLVYWRQNVPGLDNNSRDDERLPMKNWWPFLFY